MTTALAPYAVQQFTDSNGALLSGGKVFTYAAGTTTKIATYTDSGGGTTFSNPIILNTRGEPTNPSGFSSGIWLTPGVAYKFVLSPSTDTDPPTNAIWTVDNITTPAPLSVSAITDTGSANVYVASFSPAPASQSALFGVPFTIQIAHPNTGASTLNINSFGAQPIVRRDGTPLLGGELLGGQFATMTWTATTYQLQGIAPSSTAVAEAFTDAQSAITPSTLAQALRFGGFTGSQFRESHTAGTTTLVVPTGVFYMNCLACTGGGGGGGGTVGTSAGAPSAASGGNSGGNTAGIFAVTPGTTITMTVGAGGTAGNGSGTGTGGNGGTGGTSVVLNNGTTQFTAGGGAGGLGGAAGGILLTTTNASLPTVAGGSILQAGQFGQPGIVLSTSYYIGGSGGGFGGGGASISGVGNAGSFPGAAGGGGAIGASTAQVGGGAGFPGQIIITW